MSGHATAPFYDDGACLGPNKGCDECASDSDCVQMDGSKDTYGRHFFSSRSCEVDCDDTGGDNGRRRSSGHCETSSRLLLLKHNGMRRLVI